MVALRGFISGQHCATVRVCYRSSPRNFSLSRVATIPGAHASCRQTLTEIDSTHINSITVYCFFSVCASCANFPQTIDAERAEYSNLPNMPKQCANNNQTPPETKEKKWRSPTRAALRRTESDKKTFCQTGSALHPANLFPVSP